MKGNDPMFNLTDCDYYQAIKDYASIMVFGAGVNGRMNQGLCETLKKDISCYLVSSQHAKADSTIHGVPVRRIDDISVSEKQESLVIVGRAHKNHQETARLLREHGFCHIIPGINQILPELSEEHIASLRDVFGRDLVRHIPTCEKEQECSLRIYAVTSINDFHKTNRRWGSKYIEYIQAGAALTRERICKIADDTGDNISQYNRYLNETTAGYWIAKNDTQHKYVGLFHYCRGMDLSDRQLEWIAGHDIDVVLKTPMVFAYDVHSYNYDWPLRCELICQYAPDYADAVSWYLKNRFFFQGNIQIAKREIFKEYYEWVFRILKDMGEMYPDAVLKDERSFGFLVEELMNIWYIKNAGRFAFAFAPALTFECAK